MTTCSEVSGWANTGTSADTIKSARNRDTSFFTDNFLLFIVHTTPLARSEYQINP